MYLGCNTNKLDRENILWDIDLKSEFRGQRRSGLGFVIDVLDRTPKLALYQMKVNYSTSTILGFPALGDAGQSSLRAGRAFGAEGLGETGEY